MGGAIKLVKVKQNVLVMASESDLGRQHIICRSVEGAAKLEYEDKQVVESSCCLQGRKGTFLIQQSHSLIALRCRLCWAHGDTFRRLWWGKIQP